MKGDMEGDTLLEECFARLKGEDASRAPDFSTMIARARSAVEARAHATGAGAESATVIHPDRASATNTRRRVLRWAIPMAVAACLAAIAYLPRERGRVADQEFDRLVSEWSRTSDVTRNAPTDGLLATPAIGLMQNLPAIGSGVGAPRGRS